MRPCSSARNIIQCITCKSWIHIEVLFVNSGFSSRRELYALQSTSTARVSDFCCWGLFSFFAFWFDLVWFDLVFLFLGLLAELVLDMKFLGRNQGIQPRNPVRVVWPTRVRRAVCSHPALCWLWNLCHDELRSSFWFLKPVARELTCNLFLVHKIVLNSPFWDLTLPEAFQHGPFFDSKVENHVSRSILTIQ